VIFDTEQYYIGDEHYSYKSVIEEMIELLEYLLSLEDDDIELEKLLTRRQCHDYDLASATQNTDLQIGSESSRQASILEKQSACQHEPQGESRVFSLPEAFTLDAHEVPEGY
jgi:hypothetical protein